MKSKRFRQFICILLVIIFVFQLVPVYALPIGETEAPEDFDSLMDAVYDKADAALEEATIIGEVENLREESVKHFRMSDGSFVAIEYAEPVHYSDSSGKWKDIDNTLKLRSVGETEMYTAQMGDVTKHFAKDLGKGNRYCIHIANKTFWIWF